MRGEPPARGFRSGRMRARTVSSTATRAGIESWFQAQRAGSCLRQMFEIRARRYMWIRHMYPRPLLPKRLRPRVFLGQRSSYRSPWTCGSQTTSTIPFIWFWDHTRRKGLPRRKGPRGGSYSRIRSSRIVRTISVEGIECVGAGSLEIGDIAGNNR